MSDLDNILLFSSECNLITSVPHIEEAAKELYKYTGPIELDGELYHHGWDFSDIHSIVGRTVNLHPDHEQISYYLFDIVDEYLSQIVRLGSLIDLHKHLPYSIYPVPTHMCHSLNDVHDAYQQFVDAGYEGIIIRDMYSKYVRKRNNKVLKFKPKKEDWYEIVNAYEAIDKYGSPKGMIGGFNCTSDEGTVFSVGAGKMSHKRRRELWENRGELKGKKIVVQYQSITPKGAPRFGLFVDFVPKEM